MYFVNDMVKKYLKVYLNIINVYLIFVVLYEL